MAPARKTHTEQDDHETHQTGEEVDFEKTDLLGNRSAQDRSNKEGKRLEEKDEGHVLGNVSFFQRAQAEQGGLMVPENNPAPIIPNRAAGAYWKVKTSSSETAHRVPPLPRGGCCRGAFSDGPQQNAHRSL